MQLFLLLAVCLFSEALRFFICSFTLTDYLGQCKKICNIVQDAACPDHVRYRLGGFAQVLWAEFFSMATLHCPSYCAPLASVAPQFMACFPLFKHHVRSSLQPARPTGYSIPVALHCCSLLYGALPGTGLSTHITLTSKQLRQAFEQDQQQHTAVVQALSSSSFRRALWATVAGVCGELHNLCKGTSPACMACTVPADHVALHTNSCLLPDVARADCIKSLAVCLLSNHLHKPMQHLSQDLQCFLAKGKYGAPDSAAAADISCSSSQCQLGTSWSTTSNRTEQCTRSSSGSSTSAASRATSSSRSCTSSRSSTSNDTAVAKDASTSKPSTRSLRGDDSKPAQHRSSSNNKKKKAKKIIAKEAESSRVDGAGTAGEEEPQVGTCGLYRAMFGEGASGGLQGLKCADGRVYQLLLNIPRASKEGCPSSSSPPHPASSSSASCSPGGSCQGNSSGCSRSPDTNCSMLGTGLVALPAAASASSLTSTSYPSSTPPLSSSSSSTSQHSSTSDAADQDGSAAEAAALQALDCEEMPVTLEQLQLVLELLLLIWQPEVDEGRQRLDQQGQCCSGGSHVPAERNAAFNVGASQRDWLMLLLVLLQQAPIEAKQQLLQQRGTLFLQLLYAMLQKQGVDGSWPWVRDWGSLARCVEHEGTSWTCFWDVNMGAAAASAGGKLSMSKIDEMFRAPPQGAFVVQLLLQHLFYQPVGCGAFSSQSISHGLNLCSGGGKVGA